MIYYILLVLALTLNASANILLKVGAKRMDLAALKEVPPMQAAMAVITNWHLVLGLVFFGLNVIFYTIVLNKINITIAYPIMMAGGVMIVVFAGAFWLGESMTPAKWLGIALIAAGLALTVPRA